MMGASQRRKGVVRERQLVNRHRELGVECERVPLSGATRYQGRGGDIDIHLGFTTLIGELKSRKSGAGFVQLEHWLGDNDLLFLWRDLRDPMVCMSWETYSAIIRRLKS
jgi:hypothetical protein